MAQNESTLDQILESISSRGKAGQLHRIACVFDMDSTLFCVSTRTQTILRELAVEESFVSQFSDYADLLRDVSVLQTDWGIKEALLRLGKPLSKEAIERIRKHWRKNFFSNEYLEYDLMYEDSNVFVQMCHSLNCEVFYLTARNETLMREGSIKQLERFSFPLTKPEHLIMKSADDEEDDRFKLNKLIEIKKSFDEVYFFENEPAIIESVNKELPEIKIIFMDSTHSSRRPSPTHLPTITPESFKRIKRRK